MYHSRNVVKRQERTRAVAVSSSDARACPHSLHRASDRCVALIGFQGLTPTVSPLLTSITSRNVLLLQSLPNSIPYRQDNGRRRKDDTCVGTATRSIVERWSRVP